MSGHGTRDGDPKGGPDEEPRELREALDWFAYFQGTDPSAADRRDFQAWYDADARHRAAYAHVEAVWHAPEVERAARGLEAGETRPQRRPARRASRLAATVAAALVLVAVAVAAMLDLPTRLQADYRTATGERRNVALADGSTVVLDGASAIRTGGAGNPRRVELLAGRALFDVAATPDDRFTVVTGHAVIEVTGTEFTVALGPDGTTVTLGEGGLRVGRRAAGTPAQPLEPGQRVRVDATGLATPQAARFAAASSWVDGRLIFRNRPLSSILDELRRYHAGTILVLDPELAEVRLTGNYKLDDPVGVVAQLADLASADLLRLSDRVLVLH